MNLGAIDFLEGFVEGNLTDIAKVSSGDEFQKASTSLALLSAKLDSGLGEDGASAADDAQLTNIDLQNMTQKQQQILQIIAPVSTLLHEIAMAPLRGLL